MQPWWVSEPHWKVFSDIAYQPQGTEGRAPRPWFSKLLSMMSEDEAKEYVGLPEEKLNRAQVREICIDPEKKPLLGYVCAMAWGGQGSGLSGFENAKRSWSDRARIEQKLATLRKGGLSRAEAYELFGKDRILGLGPSYFTKLLYFFGQPMEQGRGFYIMDQWTAKSVNLLSSTWIVRLGRAKDASPDYQNKSGNYEAYCLAVDAFAAAMKMNGEKVEEMLMSKGGRDKGKWRKHVTSKVWRDCAPKGRYDPEKVRRIFPGVSLDL